MPADIFTGILRQCAAYAAGPCIYIYLQDDTQNGNNDLFQNMLAQLKPGKAAGYKWEGQHESLAGRAGLFEHATVTQVLS